MTNHFHLLVETPDANLSRGMQRLNSEYARYFNTRFAHVGHLFQQRFVSRLIESEQFFVEVLRYIARSTPSAQAFVSILQIGRGAASAERGVSDTTSE
jgi:REP element-mobilizing transposase RayT